MVETTVDVMIRKGTNMRLESYEFLSDFKHGNAVVLLDYTESGNKGSFIVTQVDGSFTAWFETGGKELCFDSSGHITQLFKDMIVDFYDLTWSLHKRHLVMQNFVKENIYVKIFDGVPKLMILLTEVKLVDQLGPFKQDWSHVQGLMTWCKEQSGLKMDFLTKSFYDFIGSTDCTVIKLRNYPDDWDEKKKGDYLLTLAEVNHGVLKDKLKSRDDFHWPFVKLPKLEQNLPPMLQQILSGERQMKRKFDVTFFCDYINLLRNSYKKFNELPENVKALCINQDGFIKLIDGWSPEFWTKIYEKIGTLLDLNDGDAGARADILRTYGAVLQDLVQGGEGAVDEIGFGSGAVSHTRTIQVVSKD
ncbi:hypothetical protein OsJ_04815 [Oryza sativa Japonica Group]|uniref:Uncharacterized protein n=1 Tax=Oryza sativa subsp. japonica TaxID=39947 RepID=A3A1N7_ORYSJ|nr:hypothetical protein OsJ_04815 [Oryza sativa Japonica Group]